MFSIAIVGSAEVVIRAIGDKLEGDIQKALERSSKGARSSGQAVGDDFGKGVSEGIERHDQSKHIKANSRDIDRIGLSMGKRLGTKIGQGVEKSRLRSSLTRSLLKLGVVIPIIGTLVGGISTLVSGLYSIVAAVGTASTALIALPGIFAAIGQGAVVASVGFNDVGKAISAGLDPTKASQFQKALATLPESAQSFVKEFVTLRDTFKDIRTAASDGLFNGDNGLTQTLKEIEPLLPRLESGFRRTGEAIAAGLGSAIDRLTSDNALNNFADVAQTNNIVIQDLGVTFGNLGATIIATLGAAGPVITQFSGWLGDFTERLRTATEAGANSGSLTLYFQNAAESAKILIDITKDLFVGLFNIGQIAQPFGQDLLLNLRGAADELSRFTDSGSNVVRLTTAFGQIHDNMVEIGKLARELGAAFLRLGTGPGIGNVAAALRDIVPDIEALLNTSLNVAPAIIQLIGHLANLATALEKLGIIEFVVKAFDSLVIVLNTIANIGDGALGRLVAPLLKIYATLRLIQGLALLTGGKKFAEIFSVGNVLTLFRKNTIGAAQGLDEVGKTAKKSGSSFTLLGQQTERLNKQTGELTKTTSKTSGFKKFSSAVLKSKTGIIGLGAALTASAAGIDLTGTTMGALAGSILPGVGTAAGAAAGFVFDLGKAFLNAKNNAKESAKAAQAYGKSLSTAITSVTRTSTVFDDIQLENQLNKTLDKLNNERDNIIRIGGDTSDIDSKIKSTSDAIIKLKNSSKKPATFDLKVNVAAVLTEFNRFVTELPKTIPVDFEFNPQAISEAGDLSRTILENFRGVGSAIQAAGGQGLETFRNQIASVADQLGITKNEAILLANVLGGAKNVLEGLPKDFKFTSNIAELLRDFGVAPEVIKQVRESLEGIKPVKIDIRTDSKTAFSSIDQIKQKIATITDPKQKITFQTDTGPITTTVGALKQRIAELEKGAIVDITTNPASISNVISTTDRINQLLNTLTNTPYEAKVGTKLGNLSPATQVQEKTDQISKTFSAAEVATILSINGLAGADQVIAKAQELQRTKADVPVGFVPPVGGNATASSIISKLLPKNTKVPVSPTIQSGALASQIKKSKVGTITVPTKANTSGANSDLKKVKGTTVSLKTKAETATAQAGINKINRKAPVNVKVTDNGTVKKVQNDIKGIAGTSVRVTADLYPVRHGFAKGGRVLSKNSKWYQNVNKANQPIGKAYRKAFGGLIRGPGTSTSDSIPALLSDGEFVVRASQTKKYLELLEAINSGTLSNNTVSKFDSLPSNIKTTATGFSTIIVNNTFNGPTTGSSRNRELDWTLRFSSATSSSRGSAGALPTGSD